MSHMSTCTASCQKYCVTLSCSPEAECAQSHAAAGEPCRQTYFVFAASSKEAVEEAFCRNLEYCPGRPGICEVRTEVGVVDENLVD